MLEELMAMDGPPPPLLEADLEDIFPYMEWGSHASSWMMFETQRKSLPRPWESGTLMMTNARPHYLPEHLMLLQHHPMTEMLATLSKPALLMSEMVCEDFTLGSGWALMDTVSSSVDDVQISGDCRVRLIRVMEFFRNGFAEFVVVYRAMEDTIVFMHMKELSGRRNCVDYGVINPQKRRCTIFMRNLDQKSCVPCLEQEATCLCQNPEIDSRFESMSLQRRKWIKSFSATSNLGNDYLATWMSGSWTISMQGIPGLRPFRLEILMRTDGEPLEKALIFVLQNEMLALHPPSASKRFLEMLVNDPKWEENEDWSQIAPDDEMSSYARGTQSFSRLTEENHLPETFSVEPLTASIGQNASVQASMVGKSSSAGSNSYEESFIEDTEEAEQQQKDAKLHYCTLCPMKCRRPFDLKRHYQTVHEGRRDYQCKLCPKKFSHKGHLNSHVKVEHEGNRDFECKDCGKVFGSRSKLDRHMRNVHEDVRMFGCHLCEKRFKERFFLNRHISIAHEGSDNQVNAVG